MRTLLALAAILSLTGCFTMHIHNGPEGQSRERRADEWHHDIIFGLAEISQPVDLSDRCPNGWVEVVNKEKFIQGFIRAVTWEMYSPWNVEFTCKKGSKSSASSLEIPMSYGIPKRSV